jgi:hypothetical protein
VTPQPQRALLDLFALCALLPVFFALVNVQFLLLYVFPLIPGSFSFFAPFIRFLAVPAIASAIAYGIYLRRSKAEGWRRYLSLNVLIVFVFLVSAELYKDALILIAAVQTPHDCLHIHTFAGSVHRMGEYAPGHAEMMRNGTPYFWSYSELKFVEGKPAPWHDCSRAFLSF